MEDGELQDYNMPLYAESPVSVQQTEESLKLANNPEFEEPEPATLLTHNLLSPVEVIEPNEAINADLKKRLFTDSEDGMLTFSDTFGRSKGRNPKTDAIIVQVVFSVLFVFSIISGFVYVGLMIWILIWFSEPLILFMLIFYPFLAAFMIFLAWGIWAVGKTYKLKFDDKNSQIVFEKTLFLFNYTYRRKRTEWGYDEIEDFVVVFSIFGSDHGKRLATIKMVNKNNEKVVISSNDFFSEQKNLAGELKKSLAVRLNIS